MIIKFVYSGFMGLWSCLENFDADDGAVHNICDAKIAIFRPLPSEIIIKMVDCLWNLYLLCILIKFQLIQTN